MFPHLSLAELVVLLAVVLLLFGPKRLPELAESMGKSVRLFKKGMREDTDADVPKATKSPEV